MKQRFQILFLLLNLILIPQLTEAQSQSSPDSVGTGFIKFDMNVDSALLVVDFDFENRIVVARGDSIELPTGLHIIDLSTPFRVPISYRLTVLSNKIRTLSFNFGQEEVTLQTFSKNYAAQNYFDANIFILTDEESEIYYQDQFKGNGFAAFSAQPKKAEVVVSNPELTEKTFSLAPRNYAKVYELYRRPDKKTSRLYSLIPGASQYYKGQKMKGGMIIALTILAGGVNLSNRKKYYNELDYFEGLKAEYKYLGFSSELELYSLGNQIEDQQEVVDKARNRFNLSLIIAAGIYAFNIADGILSKPEYGFRDEKPLQFYLSNKNEVFGNTNTLTFMVKF